MYVQLNSKKIFPEPWEVNLNFLQSTTKADQ